MQIFDVSMSITPDMPVYKNEPENQPSIKVLKNFEHTGYLESSITMSLHSGTHIDCPRHMLPDGNFIEDLDLSRVIRYCVVWDMTAITERITREDLTPLPISKDDFVIFKTRNSEAKHFDPDFIYLDNSGAELLKEKQVAGVGIDCLGIERDQPDHNTHRTLFEAGIIILEGLRLQKVPPGEYVLFAAPLKIIQVEAAPVRAVLIKLDQGRVTG